MVAKKRVKKKSTGQGIIVKSFLVLITLMIIGFLVSGNIKLYKKRQEINSQYVELKTEIEKLEEKNQRLKELFYEASQQEYLEKLIREKGLYKKPGEEVIVIQEK